MANNFSDTLTEAIAQAKEKTRESIYKDWAKAKTKETRERLHCELSVLDRLTNKLKRELKV